MYLYYYINNTMKSHNKSNGQFSEFKLNQNSRTKAKPKGGWEDDEEEKPKEIKTQEMKNLEESPQTNFKEPEKVEQEPVKQSNANTSSQPKERSLKNSKPYIAIEVEKQLIESILKPTGITTKPSDLQFKDFLRRIKTLKKEEINFLLRSKLMEFEEAGDQKAIQKCLYVIEFTLQNKIEEVCSFFSDNYSLFVNLQASQPGHKKILELTENILVLLNKADRPKKDTAKKEFKFLNSKADRSKPIAKKPEESHENGIDQDLIFSSSQPVPNESDIVITTEQPLLLENLSANGTEQPKANLFELENVFGDSSTSTGRIEEVTNKQTSSSKSTGFSFIKPKQKQQTESQIPEIKEEKKNTAKPDLTEILNMAYQPENNDTAQQTNHNPQVTYEQGNYQSYNNIQNHYNPNYPNQINPQIPVETQMNPMYVNPGISNQFGYQYPYNPYVNVSNPMVNPGIYQQTPPYNVPSFMQKINKNIHFKQDEQAQPADDKFDFIKDLMKPKNS